MGFNGLLAKEAGDNVWSLIMVERPIRDHYHEARILKVAFSVCCSSSDNSEVTLACLGFGYGQNKGSKNIFFPQRTYNKLINPWICGRNLCYLCDPQSPNPKIWFQLVWDWKCPQAPGKCSLKEAL